jgi:CubicO group peptidase (beta-lactamase class C family)
MSTQLQPELSFEVRPDSRLAAAPAVGELRGYLASLLADGFPPSVSLAVLDRDGLALQSFGGYACMIGEPVPTTSETSYDLASLTKVVCTVTLVLMARERGLLDLEDPVVRWLPEYPHAEATLWHLLTHTAGLVGHMPFFATLHGRGPIEAAVYEEARSAVPGSPVQYSDLGYMLLGWTLEACFRTTLDAAFASMVAGPLGLARAGFRPAAARLSTDSDLPTIAATELDGDQRPGPGLVWGDVHDGNAYALGGVAGHAGLFAPAGDLVRFVQQVLAPEGALSAGSVALMSSRQAGDGEDVRGIGWRLEPVEWGQWPAATIWHTGFTGTSLLIAPEIGAAVVLLTNSVHPHRRLEDQAAVRVRVHRLLAEALR